LVKFLDLQLVEENENMPNCFVVQGFGIKTDFTNGRKINLDASYLVIKEAVEEAGLECIRADEIQHSGTIDEPMYQQILKADLVICDLSTYNVNAAYELGIRYAMRRCSTIIVAESEFKNPFDFSHIVIRKYKHLGDDIGLQEARRFKKDLKEAISSILVSQKTDSPVYTFLHQLEPPRLSEELTFPEPNLSKTMNISADESSVNEEDSSGETVKTLMDLAENALKNDEFIQAKTLFNSVHELRPADTYVLQKKALATYKSKHPDAQSALKEARDILKKLMPHTTHDTETLGLWAAVHKRLWELTDEPEDLEVAIFALNKGYILKNDYYNGINLAYLLNTRATYSEPADAIADFVMADRMRRNIIKVCHELLDSYIKLSQDTTVEPETDNERKMKQKEVEEQYWISATLWEAYEGLKDTEQASIWRRRCNETKPADWMFSSTKNQISKLQSILEETSPLSLIKKS